MVQNKIPLYQIYYMECDGPRFEYFTDEFLLASRIKSLNEEIKIKTFSITITELTTDGLY